MEALVREHLRKANTANHDSSVAAIVQESLQHLHIFRPQSQASLQATIKLLQNHVLANLTSHFSANRRLRGIIINSLSAFFWQSRQDAEEEKDATIEEVGNVAASKSDNIYLAQWRAVLMRFVKHSRPLIVQSLLQTGRWHRQCILEMAPFFAPICHMSGPPSVPLTLSCNATR